MSSERDMFGSQANASCGQTLQVFCRPLYVRDGRAGGALRGPIRHSTCRSKRHARASHGRRHPHVAANAMRGTLPGERLAWGIPLNNPCFCVLMARAERLVPFTLYCRRMY
jgi:hypothetical protein